VLVGVADGLGSVACAGHLEDVVDVGLTVEALSTSAAAISVLERPAAISLRTSISRVVRSSCARILGEVAVRARAGDDHALRGGRVCDRVGRRRALIGKPLELVVAHRPRF